MIKAILSLLCVFHIRVTLSLKLKEKFGKMCQTFDPIMKSFVETHIEY